MNKLTYFLAFAAVFFYTIGQSTLKKGVDQVALCCQKDSLLGYAWNVLTNPLVLCGLPICWAGTMIYLCVLGRTDLSVVNTVIIGGNCLATAFMGHFLFGEALSLLRFLGMILIIIGVILVSRA
jgi:multidrug transporter EmrE-like cation transporter